MFLCTGRHGSQLTPLAHPHTLRPQGAKKSFSPDDNWSDEKAGWIAVCCAAGLTLVSAVVVLPILRYRAKKYFEEL